MKNLLITVMLFVLVTQVSAQDKYFTKTGYVKFYSKAPLEDIEAINNKVQSIIDIRKNDVVITVPITAFEFEKSLMQEHFNENYMESDKFPTAKFQGHFEGQGPIGLSKSGSYNVTVDGSMTIHGVTKKMSIPAVIRIEDKKFIASTVFKIKLADHDIKIPRLAFKNIAEEVEVTLELQYLPMKSK